MMISSLRTLASLLLLVLLVGTGCQHYQLGSLAHPDLESVALAEVDNQTREPRLGPLLQMKLPAHFMVDGSLQVKPRGQAQATVHTEIVDIGVEGKGAVRTSEDRTDQDSETIYRATIYGINVRVDYWVTMPDREEPLLARRTVIGSATISEELDLTETRERAFQAAMADAANQIVNGIVEAW